MSDSAYIPRLKESYKKEIVPKLAKSFNLNNIMLVPRVEKIILNMGLGDAKLNKNSLKQAQEELSIISGQKAVVTFSKKAISNFKIREGDPVGVKVTLRAEKMYEFLDRFISIASPRIRDFRGISNNGFDGRGNYNFGIGEQIIFPEINYDKVNEIRGMNCTIVTNTNNDQYAYELLRSFGFPIKEAKSKEAIAEEAKAEKAVAEAAAMRKEAIAEEAKTKEAKKAEESKSEEAPVEEAPEESKSEKNKKGKI